MKDIDIIEACTDLGVNKNGASLGPEIIVKNFCSNSINEITKVETPKCEKENNDSNNKKNIVALNIFNQMLYDSVCNSIKNKKIPLTIGGDHSIAIASCLASKKFNNNIGLVWFDAHADFNTFETTITGNIHGVPFATITGINGDELSKFFDGEYYNPKNCVLIGARSIDYPGEMENLKKAGIKIFTTEDIKKLGIDYIFNEAIRIVAEDTDGFHFSIDTDVIDPNIAPGVSVPEVSGISEYDFYEFIKRFFQYKEKIKSIDFVEYNPLFDINNKTLDIAIKALNIIAEVYKSK